jgi:hypothetical protein
MTLDLMKALTLENRIATGNDSHVFRYDGIAVKKYQAVSADEVAAYVSLMNRSVPLLERLNYRFPVQIFGETYQVSFAGIPVDSVLNSSSGCAITTSRFVPEPNLDKLTAPVQIFASYQPKDAAADKRQFFVDLNRYFTSEQPTRLRDEFEFHISMVSRLLDFHLGAFGLYIGKYNVKLRPNLIEKSITLIVTDIAVYIPRVISSDDYSIALKAVGRRLESYNPVMPVSSVHAGS